LEWFTQRRGEEKRREGVVLAALLLAALWPLKPHRISKCLRRQSFAPSLLFAPLREPIQQTGFDKLSLSGDLS